VPIRPADFLRSSCDSIAAYFRWHLLVLLCVISSSVSAAPMCQVGDRASGFGSPDRTSVATFTKVVSVRELADGTLLVADRGDNQLVWMRWATDSLQPIGRVGSGPNEYRAIGWLYPLPGDTTLFTDVYSSRWFLLHGRRIVAMSGEQAPINLLLGAELYGADSLGNVAGARGVSAGVVTRSRTRADSLLALRINRQTLATDTISMLVGRGGKGFKLLPPRGSAPGVIVGANPLASEDQALLFVDGWIAVSHLDPYRVDWRRPDGRWVQGAPITTSRVAVTARLKCQETARLLGSAWPCDVADLQGWPDYVPAFLPTNPGNPYLPLLPAPGGRVVIGRTVLAGQRNRSYDVVGRNGRERTIELPINERLIGFGANAAFTIRTDGDGFERIVRYPWP
jgi:hypothetical protein